MPELSPERIADIAHKAFGRTETQGLAGSAEAFARAVIDADRTEIRGLAFQERIAELEKLLAAAQPKERQYLAEHPSDGLSAPPQRSGRGSGCVRFGNAIVCSSPWGRLKVGNKYVWVDYHTYCGPSFFHDANQSRLYDPVDENDPVWPVFSAWLEKFEAAKAASSAKSAKAVASR